MNFHVFSDLASDLCISGPDAEEALYSPSAVMGLFGVAGDALRTRLWSGEKQWLADEQDRLLAAVTVSGLVKLALAGTTPDAEALRIWIAGEIVPLLFLTGGYSALGADEVMQLQEVREKATLSSFAVGARAHAALCGDTPEDRSFQDYLASEVLPSLLEDGVFQAPPNDDGLTAAFEGLVNVR